MIAITIAATTLAAVSGVTARTALLRRRSAAPTVTAVHAPDIASIARGRHRRVVGDVHPDAEAVRRARARAATVAAVAAIPVPRRTPENEDVMPALPVAPFIPAPRHRR